jgi:hypothetical protein
VLKKIFVDNGRCGYYRIHKLELLQGGDADSPSTMNEATEPTGVFLQTTSHYSNVVSDQYTSYSNNAETQTPPDNTTHYASINDMYGNIRIKNAGRHLQARQTVRQGHHRYVTATAKHGNPEMPKNHIKRKDSHNECIIK